MDIKQLFFVMPLPSAAISVRWRESRFYLYQLRHRECNGVKCGDPEKVPLTGLLQSLRSIAMTVHDVDRMWIPAFVGRHCCVDREKNLVIASEARQSRNFAPFRIISNDKGIITIIKTSLLTLAKWFKGDHGLPRYARNDEIIDIVRGLYAKIYNR